MEKKRYIVSYDWRKRVIDYCICQTFKEALEKKKECDAEHHVMSRVRVVKGDEND